jgi:hypothetical protein
MPVIVQNLANGGTVIVTQQVQGATGGGGIGSVAGTGVVHAIGGVIQSPASPVNLASNGVNGDVTNVLAIANGGTGLSTIGSNGTVLTSNGTAASWQTPVTTGITQLTGNVTAGPGTGSVAATVVAINGATVPIAGALTTGNVLQVTGASALSYAAVNLAGGGNFVTGALPITNVAGNVSGTQYLTSVSGTNSWAAITAASLPTITLTGDVTGSGSGGSIATTVAKISGTTPIAVTPNELQWVAAATGPLLDQLSTSGATGANFTIQAQGSSAGTGTGGNLILAGGAATGSTSASPGNILFQIGTPVGGGTAALFAFQQGGVDYALLGQYPGAATTECLWLGQSITNGITNFAIAANSGSTTFNAQGGFINYDIAGTAYHSFTVNGWQFGAGGSSVSFGGGTGVIGITNAATAPSSSPSGGVVLYAQSAKAIGLMGSAANALIISADGTNGYGFIPNSSTTAAGLQVSLTGQTTSFAGAAGGNVQITAGQGNGTGTCAGGGVAISSASGSAALKAGVVAIQVAGTTQWSFGPTGLAITSASVTMATSGATTLTQAQYQCSLLIIATVSFTGATTLVFPGQTGVWFVDVSKVTLSTGSLAFVNGGGNSPSISVATGTQIVMVSCTGANTIVINQ